MEEIKILKGNFRTEIIQITYKIYQVLKEVTCNL